MKIEVLVHDDDTADLSVAYLDTPRQRGLRARLEVGMWKLLAEHGIGPRRPAQTGDGE